jgi:hypothetical protein
MEAMRKDQTVDFLLQWIGANWLSLFLANILIAFPSFVHDMIFPPAPGLFIDRFLSPLEYFIRSLIITLIFSFSLGIAQWLVLRKWIPNIKPWIGINILI